MFVRTRYKYGSLRLRSLLRHPHHLQPDLRHLHGALHAALLGCVCDGVVSGMASVLPELVVAFYNAAAVAPRNTAALEFKGSLDAVLFWLGRFPILWGLKIMAAERGFLIPNYALPLSPQRQADAAQFKQWFQSNRERFLATSSLNANLSAIPDPFKLPDSFDSKNIPSIGINR